MDGQWIRARLLWLVFLAGALGIPWLLSESSSNSAKSNIALTSGHPAFDVERTRAEKRTAESTMELPQPLSVTNQDKMHNGYLGPQTPQSSISISPVSGHLVPTPLNGLEDVLHFDWTPQAVIERFNRVSTVTADPQLEGMRVAWTSGARPDDLAGSLTFYFDSERRLQRITFLGKTGDFRRLEQLVETRFHLKRHPSRAAALWLSLWNGQPTSALLVEQAPVIEDSDPYSRYEIWLELNRPRNHWQLSAPLAERLQFIRLENRW